jgi:hypothetical protein
MANAMISTCTEFLLRTVRIFGTDTDQNNPMMIVPGRAELRYRITLFSEAEHDE